MPTSKKVLKESAADRQKRHEETHAAITRVARGKSPVVAQVADTMRKGTPYDEVSKLVIPLSGKATAARVAKALYDKKVTQQRITKALSAPAKPVKAAKAGPTFKPPTSLAQCADLLYETREARYALQKQVDALQAKESALAEHLIQKLPKSAATGISGKVANAKVESRLTVSVKDWPAYYAALVDSYLTMKKKKQDPTAAFLLLQKRPGEATVKEMWEAGKKVPGAEPYKVPVISCTKI